MSAPQPALLFPDESPQAAKLTPMMAQYIEIKIANPDCLLFYRMGDFYEMFFEDAEIASRALGIVLTKRGKHMGADIAMCGVPIDRADDYLQRLIALGHRVAVCEQMEDPAQARKRGPKAVVKRDVVRLVTPGTITEDMLLEPGRANMLCALARVPTSSNGFVYGLASADISTGAFHLSETSLANLPASIARFEPREIVASEALLRDSDLRTMLANFGSALAPAGRDMGDGHSAQRRIMDYFGVATLEGFGTLSRAEVVAAATLLAYIEATQIGARPVLERPRRMSAEDVLEIDAATRANLELTRTLAGKREGSLLGTIDQCASAAGSRLLAERLAQPLAQPALIARRLDSVEFLIRAEPLRDQLGSALRSLPDFIRALQRLSMARGGPRDLHALRLGIATAAQLSARLAGQAMLPDELQEAATALASVDQALALDLANALEEQVPLKARDGHFIRSSHSAELAQARTLRDQSRSVIASLQARYSEETDIRQLRIKHNNFLGYFIEVQQVHGERLLRTPFLGRFVHRQTMSDAMRFTTLELGDLDAKISSAGEQALALELQLFEHFAMRILAQVPAITHVAAALAVLDVSVTLAELATKHKWMRPKVDGSLAFQIEAGRHVVVEAALRAQGRAFVANPSLLADDAGEEPRLAIVTGPNMAGKSTFLRQNALIVVLAQMGSFVPAALAHIGIVDRLFSRVGAADDLARGRSTFMVEMVETSAILNQATPRSLVILDEIGRGTATFDGLSIAWATMEHLHDVNRSRALFATHFHELTQLAGSLQRLVNLTMRVTEFEGEVIFLHEVAHGAADRSYGIQVAKLAGLPRQVLERARLLLAELEANDRRAPVAQLMASMPLFGAEPPPSPLLAAIDALNPDEMSPKAALEALYEIKRRRNKL